MQGFIESQIYGLLWEKFVYDFHAGAISCIFEPKIIEFIDIFFAGK